MPIRLPRHECIFDDSLQQFDKNMARTNMMFFTRVSYSYVVLFFTKCQRVSSTENVSVSFHHFLSDRHPISTHYKLTNA